MKKTPWFDIKTQSPVRRGMYEVTGPFVHCALWSMWSGHEWKMVGPFERAKKSKTRSSVIDDGLVTHWRGLAEQPA